MNLNPLIDLAISLMFIYLLFSMIVTAVSELISQTLNKRGHFLKDSLKEVFNDSVYNKEFTELLYAHPMIDRMKETQTRLPSYLSSETFAQTLIDVIGREYDAHQFEFLKNVETGKYETKMTGEQIDDLHKRFNLGLEKMNYSDLKILLTLISSKSSNASSLQKNIESWFNNYMDRVSGWFKRSQQWKLFWLSFSVALVFNVNTVRISRFLWKHEMVRNNIVIGAQDYLLQHPDSLPASGNPRTDLKDNLEILNKMKIPLGWNFESTKINESTKSFFSNNKITAGSFLGWILTAFALRFGAPFWFDLLKKVINIRGAGPNPAEEQKKKTK
jgi:hypothetical protein